MSTAAVCVVISLTAGLEQDLRGISAIELRTDVYLRGYAECPQFPPTVFDGTGPFTGLSVGTGFCGGLVCDFTVNGGSGGAVSQLASTVWKLKVRGLGVDYTPGATARIRLNDPDGGTNGISSLGRSDEGADFFLVGTSWACDALCIDEYIGETGQPFPLPYPADLEVVLARSPGVDFEHFQDFGVVSLDGSAPPQVVSASVQGTWDYSGPSNEISSPYESGNRVLEPRGTGCAESVQLVSWVAGDGASYHAPLAVDPVQGSEALLRLRGYESPAGFESCSWDDIRQVSSAVLSIESPVELRSLLAVGGTLTLNGGAVSPTQFPLTLSPGTHTLLWTSPPGNDGSASIRIRAFDTVFAMRDCLNPGEPDACGILAGEVPDIDRNWLPDSCQRALGDLTLDGVIDSGDLAVVLSAWSSDDADADLNDDGIVAASDIMELLNRWGPLE